MAFLREYDSELLASLNELGSSSFSALSFLIFLGFNVPNTIKYPKRYFTFSFFFGVSLKEVQPLHPSFTSTYNSLQRFLRSEAQRASVSEALEVDALRWEEQSVGLGRFQGVLDFGGNMFLFILFG